MSKLLVINSSPRGERSLSRRLTNDFVHQWSKRHPDAAILSRDLAAHPVPVVTEAWIIGAFAPPEARTPEANTAIAVSDQLVDELLSADRFVIGVPMYNFNIPATFKAYLDQIVRVGRTFSVGAGGYEGLVKGKKALFVTSSGGSFPAGTPYAAYNFQEPYLRAVFGFIGITDVQFVVADGQSLGDAAAKDSVTKAETTLGKLAVSW
ncbi:MAG: FMN-dependent NADH-azoreductase [Verrucomicrobiota bacterium]